jgi:ATP-dependent DNA helicase RecG
LAHYIEKAGTGTLDILERCREAGLPEPNFQQRAGQFVVTLGRDWLTPNVVGTLGLNERQLQALSLIKAQRRITIGEYIDFVKCPRRTAGHDLDEFVAKRVLRRVGRGRGTYYDLVDKCADNGPNGPSWIEPPSAPKTPDADGTPSEQADP